MPPIRVGFIGLSKSGWAPNAHLPYLKASPNYEIVALCNSSVESASAAIKQYELPQSTKAYGNPEGPPPIPSSGQVSYHHEVGFLTDGLTE